VAAAATWQQQQLQLWQHQQMLEVLTTTAALTPGLTSAASPAPISPHQAAALNEYPLAQQLLQFCWSYAFGKGPDGSSAPRSLLLRMAMTEYMLLPLLRLAPDLPRVEWFSAHIVDLIQLAEHGVCTAGGGTAPAPASSTSQEQQRLCSKWAAYRSVSEGAQPTTVTRQKLALQYYTHTKPSQQLGCLTLCSLQMLVHLPVTVCKGC
jgi:hypothetical protein